MGRDLSHLQDTYLRLRSDLPPEKRCYSDVLSFRLRDQVQHDEYTIQGI